MLLAVLLLLPFPDQLDVPIRRRRLLLSGLFTALAILTKTPGLFLLPFISLILLWRTVKSVPDGTLFISRLRRLPTPLFLWLGVVMVVILLLLPAVWAAPNTVIETVGGLTNRLADSAVRPIFFLGQETLTPGPAFYPLVLAFRLSPVVILGLLLAAIFAPLRQFVKPVMGMAETLPHSNWFWLLLFSLGFLFFLNLSAKRFDRYALPAILPFILISAVGLHTAANKIKPPTLARLVIPASISVAFIYLIASLPLPLTAYNWLAGGQSMAQKVFPVGWGEETSATAKSLAQTYPDSANRTLFTSNIPAAAAFYPGPLLPIQTQALSRLRSGDFVHFVIQDWQSYNASSDQDQSNLTAAIYSLINKKRVTHFDEAQLFTDLEPADFNLSAFESVPLDIHFSEQIAIRSAGALPARWPDSIQIGIEWQRLQTADTDYFMRLELVDQAGEIWHAQEDPLLSAVDYPVRYWSVDEFQEVFYTFPLLSDIAPGPYTIQVTLFDEQGARLGTFTGDGRFVGVKAAIASLSIPAPITQLPPEPPITAEAGTELIGYSSLPESIETGLPLKMTLWWRQFFETPQSGTLRLSVGDEVVGYPLATNNLIPRFYYRLRPVWRIPAALDSGVYPLTLDWLDENGRSQWPAPIELGQIEIIARSRNFTLPDDITPLNIQLGTVAYLQQADAEVTDEAVNLTITWQAVEPDGVFYTTFVHLIDQSGGTVTQGDRPPLEPTHTWVSEQVIQEQYQLARPDPGQYTIVLGLYDQTNGLRLPLYSAGGTQLPGDQYALEVTVP
jgi:hypothetical protein